MNRLIDLSPKRMMWISVAVWVVLLTITSYAEVHFDHWWVHTGGVVLRTIPVTTFILGLMRWQYVRERWPKREPRKVDRGAGGEG